MYELVKQTVAVPKVILLGHDWCDFPIHILFSSGGGYEV